MSASQSRAADSTSVLQHGLQIEGRAADDLEHVGGGGLLLQRLPQFVEQPRVLDGDDGLGGEVLHQRDLLVGEWPNFLAVDRDCPTSSSSLSIGTSSMVRAPAEIEEGRPCGVACISRVSPNVFDLNYLLRRRYASKCGGGI